MSHYLRLIRDVAIFVLPATTDSDLERHRRQDIPVGDGAYFNVTVNSFFYVRSVCLNKIKQNKLKIELEKN